MSGNFSITIDTLNFYSILNPVKLMCKRIHKYMIDSFESGVDQMAVEFMKTALPPMLTPGAIF